MKWCRDRNKINQIRLKDYSLPVLSIQFIAHHKIKAVLSFNEQVHYFTTTGTNQSGFNASIMELFKNISSFSFISLDKQYLVFLFYGLPELLGN